MLKHAVVFTVAVLLARGVLGLDDPSHRAQIKLTRYTQSMLAHKRRPSPVRRQRERVGQ